jgi:hypothetical protein
MMSQEHHSESLASWAIRSLLLVDADWCEERRPIGNREFVCSLSMVTAALVVLGLFFRLF